MHIKLIKPQTFLDNGHFPLWKNGFPLQTVKIIYFYKFRLKRAWNYAYLACKIHNFPRQGGAAKLTPAKEPAPEPCKHLMQVLGLLPLLAVTWAPSP